MRYLPLVLGVLVMVSAVSVFSLTGGHRNAFAAFHCNRIHAVMAGYNGESHIQFVELREPTGGQNILANHKMRFYNSAGVLKATFTFPNNSPNGVTGESFLVGTAEFNKFTIGGDADYTFDNVNTVASNGGDPFHPIQYPGGKVVFAMEAGDFNCNLGPAPVDALAYGGAVPDVGTPTPAAALPNPSTNQHLRLHNLNNKPTNNGAEYTPLETVSATTFAVAPANLVTDKTSPRNNARNVLQITFPVGGVAELPAVTYAKEQAATGSDDSGLVDGIFAAAAAGALALGAATWYARRRIRS